MKATIEDQFGDVLYSGPIATHPRTDRARMRYASQRAELRYALAHHAALQLLRAADRPASYLHDDLQAAKRRPWDAPMASTGRTEHPAGFRAPVDRVDATLSACAAAASLALVTGCVALALWLSD